MPTLHQYVTTLYHHFGVRSRAQLLTRFLRQLGVIWLARSRVVHVRYDALQRDKGPFL